MKSKYLMMVCILAFVGIGAGFGYSALHVANGVDVVHNADAAAGIDQETVASTCEKHGIKQCPFCHPEVIDEMGFCNGHGVPEAICTRCRNDLNAAFKAEKDWCGGHGLPESQCELCNPGVLEKWKPEAKPTQNVQSKPQQTPHSKPTQKPQSKLNLPSILEMVKISALGSAKPDGARIHRQPALSCANENVVVRLAENSTADDAGLEYSKVRVAKLHKTLEVPAEIEYDARRHARLAPRASGIISEVRVDLGQKVIEGEIVAVIDSVSLGTAKSELLQALARNKLWEKNSARENMLLEKKLSTQRDALAAETNLIESQIILQAAEQRLRNLGLDREQIDEVYTQGDTSSKLYLRAPFGGEVIEVSAVIGERADEQRPFMSIVDTSRMWAMLDVDASDLRKVAVGQAILLNLDGQEDQTLGGRVTWISTSMDQRTRTIKVRAELNNSSGLLKACGYGTAKIITRDNSQAVLVPKSAVQWDGCCNIAFMRRTRNEFVPRKLLLGYDAGDHYEVLRGMNGGEEVVTQGSFLLKTELKKDSIGAGCCEVDHLDQ